MRSKAIAVPNPWPALAAASALALLLAMLAGRARGAERYRVPGGDVHIHDIAGTVSVEPGPGPDVEVEVTRAGRDAAQLRVEQGPVGTTQTLRVVYPSDHVVYPALGWNSSSNFRVCKDGRLADSNLDCIFGRQVHVSGNGRGLEAHADLRVLVPAGRKVAVHLAVGGATATNVNGQLLLDTGSAPVTVRGQRGSLKVDVGSGEVTIARVEGDVDLDTGSGDVHVEAVHGTKLHIDTGSGEVEGSGVTVDQLSVDTGSGAVTLQGLTVLDSNIDTGSGDVEMAFLKPLNRLSVDTGSGSVALTLHPSQGATVEFESSSGELDSSMPVQILTHDDDHTRARLGDGRARIHVDTGSGDLRLAATGAAAASSRAR